MSLRILQVLLVALPLAFWPGSAAFETIKLTLLLAGAALLVMVRAVLAWRHGESSTPVVGYAALMLVAGVLISFFDSMSSNLTQRTLILLLVWMIIAVETARVVTDEKTARQLILAAVIGGAATSLVALLQGLNLLPGADPSLGMPRTIGTLGNRNDVAGTAVVLIPLAWWLMRSTGGRRRLLLTMPLLILVVTAVVLDALGARLALVGGIMLLAAARPGNRRALVVVGTAFILVLLVWIGGAWWSHHQMVTAASTPKDKGSIRERILDWRLASEMILVHPVTGVGAGAYPVAWFSEREKLSKSPSGSPFDFPSKRATRAHNDLLQWVAETGLVGGVLLMLALVFLVRDLNRRWRDLRLETRQGVISFLAAMMALWCHSLVSFPFHRPTPALLAALLFGVVWGHWTESGSSRSLWVWRPLSTAGRCVLAGGRAVVGVILVTIAINMVVVEMGRAKGLVELKAEHASVAVAVFQSAQEKAIWAGDLGYHLGLARLHSGDPAGAARDLKQSLVVAPTFRAVLMLAELTADGGNPEQALGDLDRLAALHPDPRIDRDGRFLRGRIVRSEGNVREAVSIWTQILDQDPHYHRATTGLGAVAAVAGHQEEARRLYTEAISVVEHKIARSRHMGLPWKTRALVADRALIVRGLESLHSSD